MPSEFLFDLDSIDLSAQMMDRAAIARLLPHRGEVAMLDSVIWHDDKYDFGIAIHHVHPDSWWCEGHIPGRPIMPGVLMVEAGAQLACVLFYKRGEHDWFAGFTRIDNVRFQGQVVPGDDLYLLCKAVRFQPRRFSTEIQGIVNGKIVFDGNVTGMAFPKMGSARADAIEHARLNSMDTRPVRAAK